MDLHALDHEEFELLIGLLLKAEGYEIVKIPASNGPQVGADYEAISPEQTYLFVEVKHFRRPIPSSALERFLGDIERSKKTKPSSKGLLVTSSGLTTGAAHLLQARPHIHLWDGQILSNLLAKHPDIALHADQAASAREDFFKLKGSLITGIADSKRLDLVRRLRRTPPGKESWRAFESICVEILSLLFMPALGAPEIQNRSDDGLDIIDAIFPIRSHVQPWSLIRSEHLTRFVVGEFKNYTNPIGQREVESIAQYLWQPAKRNFGILISRSAPSASAIAARRRAWLDTAKCIVFLSDEDLIEMLQSDDKESDPFDLIDVQLENFFRSLTP